MSLGIQQPYSVPFTPLELYPSVTIAIDHLFNNQAASKGGYLADFDGRQSSYDAQYLPDGPWIYDGITYDLPNSWGLRPDNVVAQNQIVHLVEPTNVHELHFLYAGDGSGFDFEANFELTYVDSSTETITLSAKNWWTWTEGLNSGTIESPYHFEMGGSQRNWNSSHIFQWSSSVSSRAPLRSIRLSPPKTSAARLHIFAMSMSRSACSQCNITNPAVSVRRVRFTTQWEEVNGTRAQVAEVTLANLTPQSAFSQYTSINSRHEIELTGTGLTTVAPGVIHRLVASDQVRIKVLVSVTQSGGNATVRILDSFGNIFSDASVWPISPLREFWTPDPKVLRTHETPTWWNEAKFGIFIHWGIYSVPAWAPPNQYPAWYDWDLHAPNNPTTQHHLKTYGPNVIYDDFIANFTATKFNASAWVNLFDDSGAKYFVFVTKHHDGYALFDTGNTTHRNSLHLGPKRDFLDELFATAKREKPSLHRGAYYSLPEWHSPDYARYGFETWPGGLAHNIFNSSQIEPYNGRLDINDYLMDLQFPHMIDLVEKYDAEIMWCDIGGPNMTLEFASRFYNYAARDGRQVTINNRCGVVPDFDTPEYTTFVSTQMRKWETSEGMDPYSYAYNSATAPGLYKNATKIVHTLVDVVSKNGNYLLGVGPNAEGEIVEPMVQNLLDTGKWLQYSGHCVYNTDYWFQGSEDVGGDFPIRFLTTLDTFCIISFSRPTNGQLVVNKRLPILQGDEIVLLSQRTASQDAIGLSWFMDDSTGQLVVNVSESDLIGVEYAWAFEVRYKDAGQS